MLNPLTEVETFTFLTPCKNEDCSCNYCNKKKSIMNLGFDEKSVAQFMEKAYDNR